jgi:hypothetical protein
MRRNTMTAKTEPKVVAEDPKIGRQRQRIAELEQELSDVQDNNRDMFQYLCDRSEDLKRQSGVSIENHGPDKTHSKQRFEVSYLCPKEFKTRVEALEFAERLAKILEEVR